jgi:hypothetical protein
MTPRSASKLAFKLYQWSIASLSFCFRRTSRSLRTPCWRVFPGMRTGSAISRQIWETPELLFHEQKSSALLRDERKAGGFTIQDPVAGMPTAFTAT